MRRDLIPPVLYKYVPPERLDILTRGLIRISQRGAVNDQDDLRPNFRHAARPEKLISLLTEQFEIQNTAEAERQYVLSRVLNSPGLQDQFLRLTLQRMRVFDSFGMLCLTDTPLSDYMWTKYAAEGRGFVLAFDMRKLAGTDPPALVVRQVIYTDEDIEYLFDGVNLNTFFRKETRWAFEGEWRGLRDLRRCKVIGEDQDALDVYVMRLPQNSIAGIIVEDRCEIEMELRHVISIDARYRHVKLRTIATAHEIVDVAAAAVGQR